MANDIHFSLSELSQLDEEEPEMISKILEQITEFLQPLFGQELSLLAEKLKDFIIQVIPSICLTIQEFHHLPKQIFNQVISFFVFLLQYVVSINIPPDLLSIFSNLFENKNSPLIFDVLQISDQEKRKILKFDYEEVLKPPNSRPAFDSSLVDAIVPEFFKKGLFNKTLELFHQNKLTIAQISPVLKIFSNIESAILPEIAQALLIPLSDAIIYLLQNQEIDLDNNIQFLFTFHKLMPEKLPEIIKLLCKFSLRGPLQIRQQFVQDLITLLEPSNMSNPIYFSIFNSQSVFDLAEQTLFNMLISSDPQNSFLSILVPFFDEYSKVIPINSQKITSILKNLPFKEPNLSFCVSNLIQSCFQHFQKGNAACNIDQIGEAYLSMNSFDLHIGCTLIELVTSDQLAEAIFQSFLNHHDEIMKTNFKSLKIGTRLSSFLERSTKETSDPNLIIILSNFYICSPPPSSLTSFVAHIIILCQSEDPSPFLSILYNLSSTFVSIDASEIILTLFDNVLPRLLNSSQRNDPKEFELNQNLVRILRRWIKVSEIIPFSLLFERFKNLNWAQIPSELPYLLQKFIYLSDGFHQEKRDLFFKILNDTVPPRHSNWFINLFFDELGENEGDFIQASSTILELLSIPEKRTNASYLIYAAALREADFFYLDNSKGFIQKFIYKNEVNEKIDVNLSPLHSARRIYISVANNMGIPMNLFNLYITESDQEKLLHFSGPLSSIPIDGSNPINIKLNQPTEADEITSQNAQIITPYFLQYLSKHFNSVFDVLGLDSQFTFEDELLAQVLELFGPNISSLLKAKKCDSDIQLLLTQKCQNPLLFKDSLRLFPYAVFSIPSSAMKSQPNLAIEIIRVCASHHYDRVSLAILCSAIRHYPKNLPFTTDLIQQCLLTSQPEIFQKVIVNLIPSNLKPELVLPLLPLTLKPENRKSSGAFFQLLSQFNFSSQIYYPLYKELEQFEYSYIADPDQTFISLMKVIPRDKATIELTCKRLFSLPTIKYLIQPFIHTIEAWEAAFNYLLDCPTDLVISALKPYLFNFESNPTLRELSNDFTYKGRNGIVNLGTTCYLSSLLQVLSSLCHFSLPLIEIPDDHLSPFPLQLREIFSHLRYVRGQIISPRYLCETMPGFNNLIQEDACEFLTQILDRLHSELPPELDITTKIRGRFKTEIFQGDKLLSEPLSEVFDSIFVPTIGFTNLVDALNKTFEEQIVKDYTPSHHLNNDVNSIKFDNNIPVIKKVSMAEWPDYLVFQLQRWEYSYETGERNKLVQDFGFPVDLRASILKIPGVKCPWDYLLTAVIVHKGSAESGHYFAILQGDDGDWYICDDQKIEYFELGDIASWAFGLQDEVSIENVMTGYLLFYRRSDFPSEKKYSSQNQTANRVSQDYEMKLNLCNEESWPKIIFGSKQFCNFIKEILQQNPDQENVLQAALAIFFNITISDQEEMSSWLPFFEKSISNSSMALSFFHYIDEQLKKSLVSILALPEYASSSVMTLIKHSMALVSDSTFPITTFLDCFDIRDGKITDIPKLSKRMIISMYEVVEIAAKTLKIDWIQDGNDITLSLMIKFLFIEIPRDFFKSISRHFYDSLNVILGVLAKTGYCSAYDILFQFDHLELATYLLKKSTDFAKIVGYENNEKPEVLADISVQFPSLKTIIDNVVNTQNTEMENQAQTLDLHFIWDDIKLLLFSDDSEARSKSFELFCSMLPMVSTDIEQFFLSPLGPPSLTNNDLFEKKELIKNPPSVFKPQIVKGQNSSKVPIINEPIFKDSSIGFLAVDCMEQCLSYISQHKEELADKFYQIIPKLTKLFPNIVILTVDDIVSACKAISDTNNQEISTSLIKCISYLIIYQPSIIDTFSDEQIKTILSLNTPCDEAIYLIEKPRFKDMLNHSQLFISCYEYALKTPYKDIYENLLNFVNDGIIPYEVTFPENPTDVSVIKLAYALWSSFEGEAKKNLADFLLKSIRLAKPFSLYYQVDYIQKTIKDLQSFYQN